MRHYIGHPLWLAFGAALVVGCIADPEAHAGERIGAYLDVGFGASRIQPFVTGPALCGTIGVGASTHLFGPTRAWFEFRATAGDEFPSGMPEAANAGNQSLSTFLGGLEFMNRTLFRGPFLTAGLGVGHSTISGARGPTNSPNFGFVPLHDRTAAACGLGLGYRFSGGPGPMLAQFALRTHGLLYQDMSASAYTTVITLGLAY